MEWSNFIPTGSYERIADSKNFRVQPILEDAADLLVVIQQPGDNKCPIKQ
ncbi:MAG TPA: hypothetical protein VK184_14360 [Nostocaceae cyanobacterium]|nr:hypothetical protein [Nostocaceae cyanobacterium]